LSCGQAINITIDIRWEHRSFGKECLMPSPYVIEDVVPGPRPRSVAVRVWLYLMAALVFAIIVVGGATRLTDSGLSITEWQPLLGAIPPLTEAAWHDAFEKYRQIPQYQLVNKGMSLAEFKFIYWWEWAHRFLGRFIGVAFALPLLYFWIRRALPRGMAFKLTGVLALGGLQGVIGWYMVSSGLVDRIEVSHYRLALHLTVAFLILALLVWLALGLDTEREPIRLRTVTVGQKRLAALTLGLVLLQAALGALVAGLNAGLTYNTWPLMDGRLVPSGLGTLSPWYLNLFENVTTVQFNHRMLAYVLFAIGIIQAVWIARTADDERLVRSAALLLLALLAQIGLGIWTLLTLVPLWLGLAHQAGAAIVLVLAVRHAHLMTRAPAVSEAETGYSTRPSMS
jgi:cytochrome c oxidase assembly protein subunit 15